jgi:hypothetical protein
LRNATSSKTTRTVVIAMSDPSEPPHESSGVKWKRALMLIMKDNHQLLPELWNEVADWLHPPIHWRPWRPFPLSIWTNCVVSDVSVPARGTSSWVVKLDARGRMDDWEFEIGLVPSSSLHGHRTVSHQPSWFGIHALPTGTHRYQWFGPTSIQPSTPEDRQFIVDLSYSPLALHQGEGYIRFTLDQSQRTVYIEYTHDGNWNNGTAEVGTFVSLREPVGMFVEPAANPTDSLLDTRIWPDDNLLYPALAFKQGCMATLVSDWYTER